MLDARSKIQKLHLISIPFMTCTGEIGTWRTLKHNQEKVYDATQDSACHQYSYTPDMAPLNCNPKIEISDGELEEKVGDDVKYFTQVPELLQVSQRYRFRVKGIY